jgi:FkbM family methyltransferase
MLRVESFLEVHDRRDRLERKDLALTSLNPWRHPSLLAKKAIGRLRRRLVKIPESPVIATINGSVRFEHELLSFLDEGDFRAMLTESYDIILCEYLRTHLMPGDIFLDAGANVGYISAVAASRVGISGEVHGFEPLLECYARLERLRCLNPQFRFFFNNTALGETAEILPIAFNPEGDSRNATLVPGKSAAETRDVAVQRLDQYIKQRIPSADRIKIIKIDVEGFEFLVLRGLGRFFEETPHRPAIICEIKPWELRSLSATMVEFEQYMNQFGYRSYIITENDKPIQLSALTDMEVVLFRV